MLTAVAGATTYDTLDAFDAGLVGSLGVRVRRLSDAALVVALTTSGITETAPSVYRAQFTAPGAAGSYLIEWVLAGDVVQGGTTQLTVYEAGATPEYAGAVAALRTMLGDPDRERWTDDDLEQHLRDNATYVAGDPLAPVRGSVILGTAAYRRWETPGEHWATDAELYDAVSGGTLITPDGFDFRRGIVQFAEGYSGNLYVHGACHNIYLAAADALSAWAATMDADVDWKDDGQEVKLRARVDAAHQRAAEYRSKGRGTIGVVDGAPDWGWR